MTGIQGSVTDRGPFPTGHRVNRPETTTDGSVAGGGRDGCLFCPPVANPADHRLSERDRPLSAVASHHVARPFPVWLCGGAGLGTRPDGLLSGTATTLKEGATCRRVPSGSARHEGGPCVSYPLTPEGSWRPPAAGSVACSLSCWLARIGILVLARIAHHNRAIAPGTDPLHDIGLGGRASTRRRLVDRALLRGRVLLGTLLYVIS